MNILRIEILYIDTHTISICYYLNYKTTQFVFKYVTQNMITPLTRHVLLCETEITLDDRS